VTRPTAGTSTSRSPLANDAVRSTPATCVCCARARPGDLDLAQDRLSAGDQLAPRVGQPAAAAVRFEQRDARLALQRGKACWDTAGGV